MDSVPLASARQVAEEMDKKLLATDPRLRHFVRVLEKEGTFLEFSSSFFEVYENEWLFVFSEHHPVYVQHKDEVSFVQQFLMVKSEGF